MQVLGYNASVTNGSAVVTDPDATFVTDLVAAGHGFTVVDSGVSYTVASVDSETQITLSANYAGTTDTVVYYAIFNAFTSPDGITEMSKGDVETATIYTRGMRKIQDLITTAGSALTTHIADTTTHGTTGDIVGTSDSQTLTNKTITAAGNILDATLEDVAGLIPSDGGFIVGDGANFVVESGATALTSIGGQPIDGTLTSISSLGTAANKTIYTTGVDTWAETDITVSGRAILNLNGGLVFSSKSSAVTYIDANGVDNGRAYFITSADGGEFIGITGGSGYSNDSASSCGTVFIPTGGDGSSALKRRLSGYIHTDAFGITFDGTTDDRAAWIEILAAASANNVKIKAKAGTSLIQGSISPSQYCTVEGVGLEKTIIKFQNTGATLIGVVCASDMIFRDLTLQSDVNSQTWCAAHGFSSASVSNVFFERVKFKGTTTKTGNWAGWISGGDATKVRYIDCEYDLLTFGIAKDNADTSAQKDFYWHNPKATNCTDVININSPAGSWSKIGVFGGNMENISQFPIAFAGSGCYDSMVNGTKFYDTQYEAVHYEAGTHDHIFTNFHTQLTNQSPGVVGSSGAMNGAFQAITGSYNIKVLAGTFTLTSNTTGSPNGVVAQSGGGGAVSNIDVHGNTFLCKSGCVAVYANNVGIASGPVYGKGIDISGNTFENQAGSKSSKLLDLPYSIVSGTDNVFVNPGAVLNVDDNSYGGLRNSTFTGDLSTLDFLTGNGASGTSVVFNGFTLREDFTVDATPTWQNVVPIGTLFDGLVSMRYIGNGTAEAFTKTVKLRYDGTTLTIADEQAHSSGAVSALPGAPHWQVSGGYLQSKAYRATSQDGQVLFTFDGPWYP